MVKSNWPTRIGVVGAGQMGSGIAQVCLAASFPVVLVDSMSASLERAKARISEGLAKSIAKGLLIGEVEDYLSRLTTSSELSSVKDCDLIIEAVPEELSIKQGLLSQLAEQAPTAILASNTSSLPISKLAGVVRNPERMLGLHFFNPVPVLPLVEIVAHSETDISVVERCRDFVENTLGKQAVVSADRSGFIVNALLIPYLCSAINLLEAGVASATDIDRAMVAGCSHPMGPLALTDLIGLDTVAAIANTLAVEQDNAALAPPSLLLAMVRAGKLGRKSGAGFFEY